MKFLKFLRKYISNVLTASILITILVWFVANLLGIPFGHDVKFFDVARPVTQIITVLFGVIEWANYVAGGKVVAD